MALVEGIPFGTAPTTIGERALQATGDSLFARGWAPWPARGPRAAGYPDLVSPWAESCETTSPFNF